MSLGRREGSIFSFFNFQKNRIVNEFEEATGRQPKLTSAGGWGRGWRLLRLQNKQAYWAVKLPFVTNMANLL